MSPKLERFIVEHMDIARNAAHHCKPMFPSMSVAELEADAYYFLVLAVEQHYRNHPDIPIVHTRTFVYRAVLNGFINDLRVKYNKPFRHSRELDSNYDLPSNVNLEGEALAHELGDKVYLTQRESAWLHLWLLGYSFAEISRIYKTNKIATFRTCRTALKKVKAYVERKPNL